MYADKKKMKKTKREQLLTIENMNRTGLDKVLAQQNDILEVTLNTQKLLLVLRAALVKKHVVTELELTMVAREFDDYNKMESQAMIIDPNKGEKNG